MTCAMATFVRVLAIAAPASGEYTDFRFIDTLTSENRNTISACR